MPARSFNIRQGHIDAGAISDFPIDVDMLLA
jgi:hypothetical protein